MKTCEHIRQIHAVAPTSDVCDQCVALGDTWVHLRYCLICGQVGCCDSSKNKHATQHYHTTGHPVIQSLEPGENWKWCYVDQAFVG